MIARRVLVVAALAGIGVFLGPVTPACACSCAEMTPEQSFAESEMAFVGVVTKIDRPLVMMNSGQPIEVTLAVSEVYKGRGAVSERFVVTTASDGAACGYDFVEGGRYVVLASTYNGTANTGLCSGNRNLAVESNPYSSGAPPLAGGPAAGWTTTATVAAAAGVVAALAVGLALLLRWRRRTPIRPVDAV
jgi:hypothetical protein